MIRRIVIVLLVIALAAAVLFGIVHGYELWRDAKVAEGDRAGAARVQALWDADKLTRAAATLAAVAQARKEEQDTAAAAAKGEKDARDRAEAKATELAAAARRSAAAAGGLSGKLAALDAAARSAGSPDAASCPRLFAQQRDDAIQARGLFGSCVAEYRSLGEDADAALASLELKLDTALSWINATGAPGSVP